MTSGRGIITDFMLRFSSILVICFAVEWLAAPAAARAQGSLAGCKAYKQQNMTGVGFAGDHFVLDGTPDAPVQIDCDDMQFFADHIENFQKEGRVTAHGQRRVRLRREPDCRRADGVQHEDARPARSTWRRAPRRCGGGRRQRRRASPARRSRT